MGRREQQPTLFTEVQGRRRNLQDGFVSARFAFGAGGAALLAEAADQLNKGNLDAMFLAGGVGAGAISMAVSKRIRYPAIIMGTALGGEAITQLFTGNAQGAILAGIVAAGCFATGKIS